MEPYGLSAITAFERLAYLKTNTVAGGQSSYARNGLNFDWISSNQASALGHDGEGDTLLAMEGPGVVYRIWCTGFQYSAAIIKIWIDGNLVWQGALSGLFAGDVSPFFAPLVGSCPNANSQDPNQDGFYCYLPIPFQSSIKIVVADFLQTNGNFYYNIGYHRFDPQERLSSWTGHEDTSAALAIWSRAGADPNPKSLGHVPGDPPNIHNVSGTIDIMPGHSSILLDVDGPGSISAIKLRFPDGLSGQLDKVWLHISWDGEPTPSVDAPISMFFALGQMRNMSASRTLAVGFDGNWLYCYFPMPFRQHAKIAVNNESIFKIEEVSYGINYSGFDDDFLKVGYFKTEFSQQFLETNGPSISFLHTEGTGHLVGVVESVQQLYYEVGQHLFCSQGNGFCMLEGDEKIYVDDCKTPIIQGTGTEDFFNSAWYFGNGKQFSREVHGCTFFGVGDDHQGRVSAHRLFLPDTIPFRKNIRAVIEHWPNRNDVEVLAWTLAYYYHQSTPRAILCDTLFVGDRISEAAHQYVAGPGWHGSRTYTFEGDEDRVQITRSGRAHQSQSSFVVTIPPYNQGLILRRMFDYSIGDQKARVMVDDEPVGIWFTAGSNPFHQWREDDFLIPKVFTHGKTQVTVTIQFISSTLDWNEFQYSVYSRHETDTVIGTPFTPIADQQI